MPVTATYRPAQGQPTLVAEAVGRSVLVDVIRYRCSAGPQHRPYAEMHGGHSLSLVRSGSFSYTTRGRRHEMVAGAVLVGRPGDEYVCSHGHHECGDECLAFHYSESAVDQLGAPRDFWKSGAIAPLAVAAALGELARIGIAAGHDEVALTFAASLAPRAGSRHPAPVPAHDRRRVARVADWIDCHAREPIGLADAAAQAGQSPWHFLRVFARTMGVTPHQYLIRRRLAHAAGALVDSDRAVTEIAYDCGFADLSNFVRSFRRASGLSPGAYRASARRASGRQAGAH